MTRSAVLPLWSRIDTDADPEEIAVRLCGGTIEFGPEGHNLHLRIRQGRFAKGEAAGGLDVEHFGFVHEAPIIQPSGRVLSPDRNQSPTEHGTLHILYQSLDSGMSGAFWCLRGDPELWRQRMSGPLSLCKFTSRHRLKHDLGEAYGEVMSSPEDFCRPVTDGETASASYTLFSGLMGMVQGRCVVSCYVLSPVVQRFYGRDGSYFAIMMDVL